MSVSQRNYSFVALALIALGVMVRWYTIIHAGSWWFDESLSYSFAKLPISSSWRVLQFENNPPLYFWLLRLWGLCFSFSEFSLRLLSLLLGFATIIAIIRFATKLFGREVGLWAGAMYAVASLAIFLDSQAWMYSLLGLLIIVAYWYFVKILFETPTRLDIFIFIMIVAAALYINITALWIPISQLFMITFIKPKIISRTKAFLIIIAPVILFLPWLIAFALERISFSKDMGIGTWRYFRNGFPWQVIFAEPLSFFNFLSIERETAASISLIGGLIVIGWFLNHAWKRRHLLESKLFFVALGIGVPLGISFFTVDLGAPRYYYQSAIFFWIALAYGIQTILKNIHAKIAIIGIFIGIICYAAFNIVFSTTFPVHGNWDDAARWIDAQHLDLVLAMPKMWGAEVYGPLTPFYFLPPPILALQHFDLDPLQMVTRYSYNGGAADYTLSLQEADVLRTEIVAATASSSRLAFGYQGSDAEQAIMADLAALGFQHEVAFRVDGYLPEVLMVFHR